MSSANLFPEVHEKLRNERALSTEETCTCEYVTLLQSFLRVTLNIHWYIAQNFLSIFPSVSRFHLISISELLRIFSVLLEKSFIFQFHLYFPASFAFYFLEKRVNSTDMEKSRLNVLSCVPMYT